MEYKIVFIPVLGGEGSFEQEFETLPEAVSALSVVANYTLMLHERSLMPDFSNVGMISRLDDDEWTEIDNDGNEI